MINGAHVIVYSKNAEAVRTFCRDVLRFNTVDAGHGWLIFGLPPAELGIHPDEDGASAGKHQLYLMCNDINRTVDELKGKGVEFAGPVSNQGWGMLATIKLPGGGGELGLYQPRHPTAIKPLRASARANGRARAPGKKTKKKASAPAGRKGRAGKRR